MILVILLAAVGPLCLPFALARGRHGAAYTFCVTNLITLLPMIGIATWAPYHPPPTCRQLYPQAPCDGIPYEGGLLLINLLFIALALWGLLASACATAVAFHKR